MVNLPGLLPEYWWVNAIAARPPGHVIVSLSAAGYVQDGGPARVQIAEFNSAGDFVELVPVMGASSTKVVMTAQGELMAASTLYRFTQYRGGYRLCRHGKRSFADQVACIEYWAEPKHRWSVSELAADRCGRLYLVRAAGLLVADDLDMNWASAGTRIEAFDSESFGSDLPPAVISESGYANRLAASGDGSIYVRSRDTLSRFWTR